MNGGRVRVDYVPSTGRECTVGRTHDNSTDSNRRRAKPGPQRTRGGGTSLRAALAAYPWSGFRAGRTDRRSYGSYTSTDEGILTDGAMLVALVVLALFLVFIVLSKRTISKHVTNVIMRTCVALEAFVLMLSPYSTFSASATKSSASR